MPKSVLDIEVNDQSFKKFTDLFAKYQQQVKTLPGQWDGVNKGMQTGFELIAAAMLVQTEMLEKSLKQSDKIDDDSKKIESRWKGIANSAGDFANKVARATQSLVRWTGITAEIGGLIGAGGLWGLDRLSGAVSSGRRANLGLGVTLGERAAFGLNFSRITDTGQLLNDVNAAQHDPSQLSRLYAAGVRNPQGMDSAKAALAVLDSYKALADRTDPRMLGAVLQAHGGLVSLQDFERLKNIPGLEYAEYRKDYETDKGTLDLPPDVQEKWQTLNVQLSRAGDNIKTAFVTGLTPLMPALTDLSTTVSGLVLDFLKWAQTSGVVKDLNQHLKEFDAYLKSDQFKTDLARWKADAIEFKDAVVQIKDDVVATSNWLHKELVSFGVVKNVTKGAVIGSAVGTVTGGILAGPAGGIAGNVLGGYIGGRLGYNQALRKANGDYYAMLPAIASVESNNNPNAVSSKGALGMYQLMPATAAQYGVNPMDPIDAAEGAGKLLSDLAKHYAGDLIKTLAAYNWGEGNVDKDIKKYGSDWQRYLPSETREYERKILSDRDAFMTVARAPASQSPAIKLEILNATGANVVVTGGQVAR